MDLTGGIWVLGDGSDTGLEAEGVEEACLAVSDDPVSIWTTCLKEEVSAWTKVVGYGLADSDLVMGFGVWGGPVEGEGEAWTPLLLVELVVLLVLWLFGEGRRELFNWCLGEVSIDGSFFESLDSW